MLHMFKLADNKRPRNAEASVFVLGLFDTGLAVVRLLARSGVWVEGFDHVAANAGFATRLPVTQLVPRLDSPDNGLLAQTARRVADLKRRRETLIPASDYYVQWICDHAEEWQGMRRGCGLINTC
jgi:nucleotide-binding universal stress UspA family protein